MSINIQIFRARIYAFEKIGTLYPDYAAFIRNGTLPDDKNVKEDFEILENEYFAKKDTDNKTPLSFTEICQYNTWFAMHPEKLAGKEKITTSREFPVTIVGTKDDIIRVIKGENTTTDEIDVNEPKTLREPVLRYKADGNTLTNTNVSFEPIPNLKNAYKTIKPLDDSYNEKFYSVILKIEHKGKSIFIDIGELSISQIINLQQSDIDNEINKYINDILDTSNEIRFISSLKIELAKQMGYDTKHLEFIRTEYKKKRELQELQKKQEREELKRIEAEKQKEKLKEALNDLKNSNKVDGESLIDLSRLFNVSIHPRTVSAIRKYRMSFIYNGDSITLYFHSKKKVIVDTRFIHELITHSFDSNDEILIAEAEAEAVLIMLKLR